MNGAFNEMANFNGMAALETPEFMVSKMDELRRAELLQPLLRRLGLGDEHPVPVDQAGRLALGRHPQRHDRALAERHRRAAAGCARSSPTSSTSPRPSSRPPGCPSRRWSTACSSRRWRARSMLYTFNDAGRPGTPRPAVLRDVRQPRHLPQGLERGHQAPDAVGAWSAATFPRSTTTSGSSTTATSDYSQAHDLAAEQPRDAGQAAAALADRGHQVQRAAPGRPRLPSGSTRRLAGRPTLIRGNSQLFFPGMGRLSENSVVSIKNKSFSVTAEVDGPRRRRRGRDHRPGRPLRRLGRLRQGRPAKFVYNVLGIQEFTTQADDADPGRQPPGADGVRLRRRRARPRAATSPSTTTAPRSAPGASSRPSRWSSPPTRPPTSATSPAPPSAPTTPPRTSRFTGKINWVQIDLGDDDHDHFIDPEERLRIALSMQ